MDDCWWNILRKFIFTDNIRMAGISVHVENAEDLFQKVGTGLVPAIGACTASKGCRFHELA